MSREIAPSTLLDLRVKAAATSPKRFKVPILSRSPKRNANSTSRRLRSKCNRGADSPAGWRFLMFLRIHARTESSRVNGPGCRAVIWLQGCSLDCEKCWNPKTHPPAAGDEVGVSELVAWTDTLWRQSAISGLTLSGGEP